ncbi:DUF6263 family protein [Winogradskyella sp. HB-48]|uniref:DUF6263 family protein n=1 Tax=Winogradskyella sp. HB-48 TaxID=3416808 RepID=UPI003CE6DE21
MKKILVALLLCISTLAFSQEKTLLRLNYKKGDVYEIKTVMNQNMGEVMTMDMDMTMSLNVTEVKDNNITTEATFNHVKMSMESMGQKMAYDSNTKESEMDPFAQGAHAEMKKLIESVVLIENDTRGNITNTELKSGTADISAFKDNMGGMIYPEDPVEVGTTWSASKEQQGMTIESTYKVTAITDDTVELEVTGKITGTAEGTLDGKSNINKETGNVIKSEVNMAFTVEGQKVGSTITITSTKK